jgi:hypothetical protein
MVRYFPWEASVPVGELHRTRYVCGFTYTEEHHQEGDPFIPCYYEGQSAAHPEASNQVMVRHLNGSEWRTGAQAIFVRKSYFEPWPRNPGT